MSSSITIIRADDKEHIYLEEIWSIRGMFFNLVRTNALKPYIGKIFGYFWTLLRPFIFLGVMVFIKYRSSGDMGSDLEYPLFLYSGLILWWYFVDALKQSMKSPNTYRGLITKIYFPRIIIPAVPVIGRLFDLVIQIVGIIGMMVYYKHFPDYDFFLIFIALFSVVLLTIGLGYILSVLTIVYPDVERVVDYILYVGLFLSPVIYDMKLIPEMYQNIYTWFNPMAGILMAFRGGLFSGYELYYPFLLKSFCVSSMTLAFGIVFYQKIQTSLVERM